MNILITGGFGAIGLWSVKCFIKAGINPVVFARNKGFNPTLIQYLTNHEFKFYQGDILRLEELLRAIKRYDIKRIIHLAAYVSSGVSLNPIREIETNINGTMNVIEACLLENVERLVFASSKAVYANVEGEYAYPKYKEISEDYPVMPDNAYGIAKLTCEQILNDFHRKYGLDYVALRFGSTYGPGKTSRHGVYAVQSDMIENAYKGLKFDWPQGGDEKDDMVYNADIGRAIYKACIAKNLNNRVFNIATGKGSTLRDLSSILKEYFPHVDINVGPGKDFLCSGNKSKRYAIFNLTRAKKELGYSPKFSLEQGVKDYINILENINT